MLVVTPLYVHRTLMLFHVLVKLRFLMSFETYLVFCVVVVGISISNPYPHGFSIEKGMMLCASSFCTRVLGIEGVTECYLELFRP